MAGDKITGGDHQLQAVWFAAGTAALIACVERAVVETLFTHWRVWAFLALNLLLLAILFTSSKSPQIASDEIHQTVNCHDFSKLEIKKISTEPMQPGKGTGEGAKTTTEAREEHLPVECVVKDCEEDGEREFVEDQISNEELNQRVEAFIAKFRQHLVSDGNKGFGKGINVRSCQGYARRRASFSHGNEYITTV
ncbi:hypothetical protein CASFOL_015108 [Castilleja foliolosa]|uniref:Uncharacterized protein n=1 Tax=Castilleja foliolosa TaxID=1961234 RepID=A0ABD3DCS1_9LAMI